MDELQRSHRFTVGVLVSVLLVSLLTSGYLIAFSQPRIIGYVELARQARDLREAMLDQETGLRGWLATGDSDFLDPYRQGRGAARTPPPSWSATAARRPPGVPPSTGCCPR